MLLRRQNSIVWPGGKGINERNNPSKQMHMDCLRTHVQHIFLSKRHVAEHDGGFHARLAPLSATTELRRQSPTTYVQRFTNKRGEGGGQGHFRLSGTRIDNDREVMPEGDLGASEHQSVVIKDDRRRYIYISRGLVETKHFLGSLHFIDINISILQSCSDGVYTARSALCGFFFLPFGYCT